MRKFLISSLLALAAGASAAAKESCKCFPGDSCWPSDAEWSRLNSTVGGRLVATVPLGSPCHDPTYNAEECKNLQSEWHYSSVHTQSSSSMMAPLFANQSCDPFQPRDKPCTLGNYVRYAVNVTSAEDVAAAVKFAQKKNIRFVIRNTGHDYLGRSTGAGALSVWTHYLKGTEVIDWKDKHYKGKALKVGAGVQGFEALATAHAKGLVVVTGECPSVGLVGGYTQGGGHSALSTNFGLAADNTLEFEVVTADGKLVKANKSQNSDLYWALSGAGSGNYGVVVSATVQAHPEAKVSGASFLVTAPEGHPDLIYDAIDAFHAALPKIVDSGVMIIYFFGNSFLQIPALTAYGKTEAEVKKILKPLVDSLAALGLKFEPTFTNFSSYYDHYNHYWGPLPAGNIQIGTQIFGGRLLPRNKVDEFAPTARKLAEMGVTYIGVGLNVSKFGANNGNSVLPQWRNSLVMVSLTLPWDNEAPWEEMLAAQKKMTDVVQPVIEAATPGAGAYINEADFQQPDWQDTFYGVNYDKLLQIKKKYDPKHLFYATVAVGSEQWDVAKDGLGHHLSVTEHKLQSHISESTSVIKDDLAYRSKTEYAQARHDQILTGLRYPEMNGRKNQVVKNVPRTFQWIFSSKGPWNAGYISDDYSTTTDDETSSDDEMSSRRGQSGHEGIKQESDDKKAEDDRAISDVTDKNETVSTASSVPEPTVFTSWLGSKSPMFWISGRPASGKSTLMKFITTSLDTKKELAAWRPNVRILSHYFWKAGSVMERSLKGFFLSLTHQVLLESVELSQRMWEDMPEVRHKWSHTDWDLEQLENALLWVVKTAEEPFLLVIDGLDECEDIERQLSMLPRRPNILDLLSQVRDVKMCVSSREEYTFINYFDGVERLQLHELTEYDIRQFADTRLEGLDLASPKDHAKLLNSITTRASGVFLWVALVVDSVARAARIDNNIEGLIERVYHMPRDLIDLVREMWERSGDDGEIPSYKVSASRYFKLAHGARGYNLWQSRVLDFAIAVDKGGLESILDRDRIWDVDEIERLCLKTKKEIRIVCHGLLEVDDADKTPQTFLPRIVFYRNMRIQFAHRCVIDFLDDTVIGATLLGACGWSEDEVKARLDASDMVLSRPWATSYTSHEVPPIDYIAVTNNNIYLKHPPWKSPMERIMHNLTLLETKNSCHDIIFHKLIEWHFGGMEFDRAIWAFSGQSIFNHDPLRNEFLASVAKSASIPFIQKLIENLSTKEFLSALPALFRGLSATYSWPTPGPDNNVDRAMRVMTLTKQILTRLLVVSTVDKGIVSLKAVTGESLEALQRLTCSWFLSNCVGFNYNLLDKEFKTFVRAILYQVVLSLPVVEDWNQTILLLIDQQNSSLLSSTYTMEPENVQVIICGGGSAGLTAAVLLARFGISFKILEKRPGPLEIGQADGVQCRTVEIFEILGISARLLEEAYHVREVAFWSPSDADGTLKRKDLAYDAEEGLSHQPHVILNQARINDLMLQEIIRLRADGTSGVLYDSQVESVDIIGDGDEFPVEVVANHIGGTLRYRAKYAIGCDGAHSTVRKAMGFKMVGDSSDSVWGVMDVYPITNFPDIRKKAMLISKNDGNLMIIPREGDELVRFYIELPGTTARDVTEQSLINKVKRIFAPYNIDVAHTVWWSAYVIGQRLADHFTKDYRVFLTGDACHTHSPKAGQGMNVSLQDGFNIGWKMAHVLTGRAPPSVLETYVLERQQTAEKLIEFDRSFSKLFSSDYRKQNGITAQDFRDKFVEAGRYTAGMATKYEPSILTCINQNDESIASGLTVGMRFPSAPVVRLSDAKPLQLNSVLTADGRWHILTFCSGNAIKDTLPQVASELEHLIKKFSPSTDTADTVFNNTLVIKADRKTIEIDQLPEVFFPKSGPFSLRNVHRVFVDDSSPYMLGCGEAFSKYDINPEQGAIVVVRPDLYVSRVLSLANANELSSFFKGCLNSVE
ncbi:hypothetical protein FPSE5266_02824 [Fusarium pseudograminearum]|nr:hypothetical protein FPSE5266_02824 [Fusarium pseudograminearum]